MSIEMNNPQTPVELVDAARNYLAQTRMAVTIGDIRRGMQTLDKAEELLFQLQTKLEESETP